jgi:hypothetical protein
MDVSFKKYLCVLALASSAGLGAIDSVTTLISPRSLATDNAIRLSGEATKQNLFKEDEDGFWGTASVAVGGTRTFRGSRSIAPCLFGPALVGGCECPSIRIAGSFAEGRRSTDLLAEYFGLPSDFVSTVSFKPEVTQIFVDFNFHFEFNLWDCEGMFFHLRVPFVHARWELNMNETVNNAGVLGYPAGYFSEADVPRSNLLGSFEAYVANGQVPNLSGTVTTTVEEATVITEVTSNVKWNPLTCGKMYGCKEKTKNRVADLQARLGWNFFQDEDYHLGAFIQASAPTGNRPCGEYLFSPIVGNGHHWTLGGGISAHVLLWQSEDENSSFGFYLDGYAEHLFKTHQQRFFDLKGKPLSRYMLAAKFGTPVANLFANETAGVAIGATATSAQFQNEYTAVANLTCCDVDVSVDVQGGVVAMFDYSWCHFNFGVGYEFWGRSCDKIKAGCDCPCTLEDQANTWALKGDAYVFGFIPSNGDNLPTGLAVNNPVALSATNSQATVFGGSNVPVGTANPTGAPTSNTDVRLNPKVDNAAFATYNTVANTDLLMYAPNLAAATNFSQQRTSSNGVFLSQDDVDVCSAQSKGMSHTVFGYLGYSWDYDDSCWSPYLSVGGKAEFAHDSCNNCDSACGDSSSTTSTSCSTGSCSSSCDDGGCDDGCRRCNFSQWGVWLKGGISFD